MFSSGSRETSLAGSCEEFLEYFVFHKKGEIFWVIVIVLASQERIYSSESATLSWSSFMGFPPPLGKRIFRYRIQNLRKQNSFPFQLICKDLQMQLKKQSDSVRLQGWWINCDHKLAKVTRTCMHVYNIRNLNSWPVFAGCTVFVHPHPSSVEAAYGLDLCLRLLSVMK
jgi:hypothetical protein